MSGKVLATIGQVLTVDVIDAMAGRAEMDRASARKAAELGVPAILTALTELVSRPSGVARLTRALAGQSTSLVEDGRGDRIGVLLGGANAGALALAIGRFVGAPKCSAYALLEQLTATILQALAREDANAHAGGEGVANLLMAEKDLIAAAMPVGLSSLLGAQPGPRRVAAGRSTMAGRGTARGEIDHPSRGGATASPLMRRLTAGPALGAVSLVALAALACYVFAAKVEQIGGGSGDGVVASLPEPNIPPQVQADVAPLDASAPQPWTDINDLGGGKMGAADVLGGLDGIRSALVRLEHFFGFGEHGIAGPVVRLLNRRHDNDPDRRLILDAEETDLLAARRQLRFASPQFKQAIHQPPATAVDKPTGPTIAAH